MEGRSASIGWRLPEPPRPPKPEVEPPDHVEGQGGFPVSDLPSKDGAQNAKTRPKAGPAHSPDVLQGRRQQAGADDAPRRQVAPPEPQDETDPARDASADRLRAWAESPRAMQQPLEELDDFAIIERIVPRTKPRGILGISFGSIKIEEEVPTLPGPEARATPDAPDTREAPETPELWKASEEDDAPRPRKTSLFSVFKRSAPEDGGDEPGDVRREGTHANGSERKQARQAERARKREEKKARKEEKKARREERRAASRDVAGATPETGEDLPGPPPESLRRPYPELRKPISAKPKRQRPEPFPELRKPPDQRRPRPEPYPELRKPARDRPRPEAFPELRKATVEPEDQPMEQEQPGAGPEHVELPTSEAVSPPAGPAAEPEQRRSGGWLSDVLKSAERATSESGGWPAASDFSDEAAESAITQETEWPGDSLPEESSFEDPALWGAGGNRAANTTSQQEEDGSEPDDSGAEAQSAIDREYRRSADEASAQAALPDDKDTLPFSVSDAPQAAGTDDAGRAAPAVEESAEQPLDAAREVAEFYDQMDAAPRDNAARTAGETRWPAPAARRKQRKTPPGQLELGLPAEAPPEPADLPEMPDESRGPIHVEDAGPQEPSYAVDAEVPEAPYTDEEDASAAAAVSSAWETEQLPPAPDAQASQLQEPPGIDEPYEASRAEDAHYHEEWSEPLPEAEDDVPLSEEQSEAVETEFGEAPESSVSLPYAELLDPAYRPRQGFMDLGRRSILFPAEEEDDAPADAFGENVPELSGEDHGAYASGVEQSSDIGESEVGIWNGADSEQTLHLRSAEAPDNDSSPPEAEAPENAGWAGHPGTGHFDEDEYDEGDEEAFVPPEPSGRPDHAAALMRSIAYADTDYYLPPSKTPGRILLGVAGAAIGAVAANFVYGMLGDVVIPRFMGILIGIQIVGGLGVVLGNVITVPLGGRSRRTRSAPMPAAEFPEGAWDFEEKGEPVFAEPQFDIPADAGPQDARAVIRP